jgi:hypothetical protein
MSPISGRLVRLLTSGKYRAPAATQEQGEEEPGEVAHAYLEAGESRG